MQRFCQSKFPNQARGRGSLICALLLFLFSSTTAVQAQTKSPVSVSIDLSAIDDPDYREWQVVTLEQRLTVRLVQAGFAVVPRSVTSAIRLVFSLEKTELVVSGSMTAKSVSDKPHQLRRISRGTGDLKETHLEVVHKAVALVRQLAAEQPPVDASRSTIAGRPVVSGPIEPRPVDPASATAEPWHFDLGLAASWLYRIERSDPQFHLMFRAQRKSWVMTGAILISPTSVDDLHVFEWAATVGAAWHLKLTDELSLDLGAEIGILHHHYSYAPQSTGAGDSGDRVAFIAGLPSHLRLRLHEKAAASVWLSPGLTSQSRTHRLDGAPIWTHSEFRLAGGVTLWISLF